ncbi:hypothetical protein JDN40_13120 [Rhodomicrobium vannielii ATCC 17100]|uniref:hypothetical protein n=1 Tax=Rhodomicrobium vannielii TaxID=1069 RepID=UPI00191B152E|nr:hypothetical protein [Rhodomicrobium vannielii]MBJ7535050.1 hypothetical protein [Rhodomicrobium vannielii ATCC 17100]
MRASFLFCVAASMFLAVEAQSLPRFDAPAASPVQTIRVSDTGRHYGRGDLFSNWCAYNCYRVSPCAQGGCYGRYHYSQYPYDEDLPFRYRWDSDASIQDNILARANPGYLRLFERQY